MEALRNDGQCLVSRPPGLFTKISDKESVAQDFKARLLHGKNYVLAVLYCCLLQRNVCDCGQSVGSHLDESSQRSCARHQQHPSTKVGISFVQVEAP